MDIWTVPSPAVFALMATVLYLGIVSMKVQKVAFNVADDLVAKPDSGVSNRNVGGFTSRITPAWAKVLGWGTSFGGLLMMIYIALRFEWYWAAAYIVGDHLLKNLEPPVVPTVSQCYSLIENQAKKNLPKLASEVSAHRPEYVHNKERV
jgi:hypothetical protein